MNKVWTPKQTSTFALACLALAGSAFLAGCGDDNDRKPTAAEGQAADAKRQAFIDGLNIPADQKARMKAQMGGPAVPNPADAARNGAGKPAGAR